MLSADYFLSYAHPKGNTPDWVKMSESVLEKGPTLGSKNRAKFLEPSIPKMLQVGSLQPPGHDTGNVFNNL